MIRQISAHGNSFPVSVDNFPFSVAKYGRKEGKTVKQEEKKPVTWEVADPKPPVVQSGHMENKKQY